MPTSDEEAYLATKIPGGWQAEGNAPTRRSRNVLLSSSGVTGSRGAPRPALRGTQDATRPLSAEFECPGLDHRRAWSGRRGGAQGRTPASRQRSCLGAPVRPAARCWVGRRAGARHAPSGCMESRSAGGTVGAGAVGRKRASARAFVGHGRAEQPQHQLCGALASSQRRVGEQARERADAGVAT
jgi:hypothetical protein